jgi:5'-nucleotidase
MTGRQVKELLEHQFVNMARPRVLFPSDNLRYEVDLKQSLGQRVLNIRIRQQPIEMNQSYNVTMNSFLASGGDGFQQFNQAPTIAGGELDVDALSDYLRKNPGIKMPTLQRIRML